MSGDTGSWRVMHVLVATAVALTAFTALAPLWNVYDTNPPPLVYALGLVSAIALIVGGIVAARQPWGRRTGVLLVVTAILYVAPAIGVLGGALSYTFWLLTSGMYLAVAAHAAIAFPDGRLRTRFERRVVAANYAYAVTTQVLVAAMYDPDDWGCEKCPRNLALLVDERAGAEAAWRVIAVLNVIQLAVIGVALVRRWRVATRPERHIVAPVHAAIVLNVLVSFVDVMAGALDLDAAAVEAATAEVVRPVALTLAAAAILAGLLRTAIARAAVADLVVHAGAGPGLSALERDIASALGDHRARVVRWDAGSMAYVDVEGRRLALPSTGSTVATQIDSSDGPLGAIIHDAALRLHRPQLVDAVAAACRLALHNERLTEDVRTQLEEVRRSRRRLVEVADEERRRIERDLHDGAQQYLIALNLRANSAAGRAAAFGDDRLAAELRDIAAHASSALDELRRLARGIRPPVLTDLGLEGALRDLAERFPLPVRVDVALDGRADDVVESTAYFAAAEGLTNALKYADAGRVHLSARRHDGVLELRVEDDGRGGAGRRPGSGIRGLRDRVEALGGTLDIESPPGEGTRLVARIPLQPARSPRSQVDDEVARS